LFPPGAGSGLAYKSDVGQLQIIVVLGRGSHDHP